MELSCGWFQDHLALMIELLGKMPRKVSTFILPPSIHSYPITMSLTSVFGLGWQVAIGGARSKDFFDRHGDLKRIRRLKFWPLDRLLVDRYKFSENDAGEFAEFLCPLLDFAPEKRPTAQQCLQHPWLNLGNSTHGEMKNETNLGKLNVGMSNLQIKVGKWTRHEKFSRTSLYFRALPFPCMTIDFNFLFVMVLLRFIYLTNSTRCKVVLIFELWWL